MKVHESIGEMEDGDILEVSATDMGFSRDIASWCRQTGNTLVDTKRKGQESIVLIRKGWRTGRQSRIRFPLFPAL